MPEDPPLDGPAQDGDALPSPGDMRLTETQRQILTALCRPRVEGNRYATPATNGEIAATVFLSVDAVKAHLRALYRKFGVEPLPHNQKRARLVELVIEGGYLEGVGPPGEEAEVPERPAPSSPPPAAAPPSRNRRPFLIGAGVALGAAAVALIAATVFSGGSDNARGDAPTLAEYRVAVTSSCQLALDSRDPATDLTTAERAGDYLGMIGAVRSQLEDLTPPEEPDPTLDRFRRGLEKAFKYTDLVANGPPEPDPADDVGTFAELTIAGGQIQAGAHGYGLGPSCAAIGNVVGTLLTKKEGQGP